LIRRVFYDVPVGFQFSFGARLNLVKTPDRDIEMEFYLPSSNGEWMAWTSALITTILGLIMFLSPALTLKILRLECAGGRKEGLATIRSTMAGFYLGVGLGCLIFAQPFLWLVIGAAWGFTLFGRFISIMTDKASSIYNWSFAILEFFLAAGPLLYAFGLVQ
jgi:hypothetical protein